MNTNIIKKYAPKARMVFIEAITQRAAHFGITPKRIEPVQRSGEVITIGQATFPAAIAQQRDRLEQRVQRDGFEQTIEHIAYSWFNRFCAIRYMELKGFLSHGRKVLSAMDGNEGMPQILEECLDLDFEGLDQAQVRQLKLANEDEALYRELLLAQCHELHKAMPFLFEAIADETELLLPNNLTKTDSLLRDLVREIPQDEWDDIEIMGWLYQFYISEKKDQVIGKVVKSEDIPAATQLFTPNWIVQYLVQNSIGRQWLQTYPESPLKAEMPYYIEPAEQTPEVQAQLAAITPTSIEPESIKVLDPACGSGHILVEAYKVLKAIYEERGYRTRDIPELILKHNLYGLDIDDRAGQLAAFTLMMLAREDDRRIFEKDIQLNVVALQDTKGLNLPVLWQQLNLSGDWQQGQTQDLFGSQETRAVYLADDRYQLLERTLVQFQDAKTFGSLIDIPQQDEQALQAMLETLKALQQGSDENQLSAANQLLPIIQQALFLAQKYDAVVANPPYMGGKGMNAALKTFAKKEYPNSKSDLFAIFMERAFKLLQPTGLNAQVNMQSWMFLSSYEQMRNNLIDDHTFITMAHLGARAFSQISGEVVQTTAWVISNQHLQSYKPKFYRLIEGSEVDKKEALQNKQNEFAETAQDDFKKIPGSPIAYSLHKRFYDVFDFSNKLGEIAKPVLGMNSTDNNQYVRSWSEVSFNKINYTSTSGQNSQSSKAKWFPYNKG
ncbi:MAG TPA: BREX-1 system adenine-specific DNA-methyltransferase PglX, partial [Gammaproteobacteria bacterium]|nr:BREX-1 system adenine-specific DNA-methyltransferase PglX [Gammaproteobacteria bacterium]